MQKNIKKYGAIILLFAFVLQSIPKIALHNFFANHKHSVCTIKKAEKKANTTIDLKSNCDCNDLFIDTFYDGIVYTPVLTKNSFYNCNSSIIQTYYSIATINNLLRGPPVV